MNKKVIILFLFICFISSNSMAHPHIFLTNTIEVVFDDNGLSGFQTKWVADDFSTAGLMDGYDENENGVIDKAELTAFEKDSVENLKKFQYFTHIKVNEKPLITTHVNNFKATLTDGKLEYSFFVPCSVTATNKNKSIIIAQYDSSYFSFISFSESQPVSITNPGKCHSEFTIAENKNQSYYFDMVHPFEVNLRFKTK